MAKQPYIQFYLGDYIKDTRILPLNVKGGWVDLILAMWDNDIKGELTGAIDDFARVMNCDVAEAHLVIQTLKQKKIFDYRDIGDGHFTIISRKQKKMEKLSKIRKETGKSGGNPVLVKQLNKNLDNQTNNLNHEYEYVNEFENKESLKYKNSLIDQMMKIFKLTFPNYLVFEKYDSPALLQMAYKIAKMKDWSQESVSNGNMQLALKEWQKIVSFISSDNWFSSRSISDLNNEFQRLTQKISSDAGNKNSTSKSGKRNNGETPRAEIQPEGSYSGGFTPH